MIMFLLATLYIFLAYIAFLVIFSLSNPQGAIQLLKLLKRYRFRTHAERYGLQAACDDLKGETWILNPWEESLLKQIPKPTAAQYYAYMWTHYLKFAFGLTHGETSPNTQVTLAQRWQALKNAWLGLELELGLVKLK